MKINLDGKDYELNTEKAIADGYLKLIDPPILTIKPGDVFGNGLVNNLLVVRAIYSEDDNRAFQILGIGVSPNSNFFYQFLHSKQEIIDYLNEKKMKFIRNITKEIEALVIA
jgi:hypothetical protein